MVLIIHSHEFTMFTLLASCKLNKSILSVLSNLIFADEPQIRENTQISGEEGYVNLQI